MGQTLATAVLLVHAAFVLFVVGGLLATWAGIAAGARFPYHRGFRIAHLAAIAFVTLEALAGIACPLTVLEDRLRGEVAERGFIQRWVHAWLYWDFPGWVFTIAYVGFLLAVIATWWRFPPRR